MKGSFDMDSLEITRLKMLISKLNELSISMVREKNIDTLIQKILYESIELTNSDGGSIYLVEENQGIKNLVIKLMQQENNQLSR